MKIRMNHTDVRATIVAACAALLFAAGCAVTRDSRETAVGVPTGAVIVKEGAGELEFEPNDDGHVYVYDATDEALVYERRVRDGDRIEVDPEDDRIGLNGDTAMRRELDDEHRHRIYFRRDE